MSPTITAFAASPDRGAGHARDMRVRWALEEVGQPYTVKLVTFQQMKQPDYKALQPFGQIPAYTEGELTLFESGAIVLHIAQTHHGLLPRSADARARAISWMFSAVSTMEQPIVEREGFILLERDKPWFAERLPMLDARVKGRLTALSESLGDRDWLEGDFTAGDLMMVMVLRRPACAKLLPEFPTLASYLARGEARPAFQRAFEAQKAVFTEAQPA